MCVLVSLATAIYGVITEKKRAKRRWQNQISIEFREGLQGIAAALQAGYSMENALEESQKDLVLLYGEHSVLVKSTDRRGFLSVWAIDASGGRYAFCASLTYCKENRRRFDSDYKNDCR